MLGRARERPRIGNPDVPLQETVEEQHSPLQFVTIEQFTALQEQMSTIVSMLQRVTAPPTAVEDTLAAKNPPAIENPPSTKILPAVEILPSETINEDTWSRPRKSITVEIILKNLATVTNPETDSLLPPPQPHSQRLSSAQRVLLRRRWIIGLVVRLLVGLPEIAGRISICWPTNFSPQICMCKGSTCLAYELQLFHGS
ncbi:hypothetical protein Fot_36049 [Forsythia ovata]|uniref:Uncharacterized protein n=1 Tax=Forsythia ovata TaxID=205694 RepID=A0ABD1SP06_9LAMI